jgi:curved DNA-binding protein CbpA
MPRPIRLPKPKAMSKKPDLLDAAARRLQDGADATTLLKQLDADPYACLGLSKTTDDAAVKKAYKKRALRFHPDKCTTWDSTELFQALGWAFERLETAEKRRAFAAVEAKPVANDDDERTARERRAKAAKRAWQKAVGETLELNTKSDRRSAETLEIKGRARQRRLQSVDEERRRTLDRASQRRTSDFAAHRRVLRERRARRGEFVEEERTSFFVERTVTPEISSDPTRIACTFEKGPMGLELAAKTASDGDEACVVASVTGAAQEQGVRKGDTLVSVNGDDLRGHGFDRCVAFVKKARERTGPCVLAFYRPRRRASSSGVSL